ncbi:MAG: ATP-binding protein, partial [Lysobacterales bacterium]
LLLSLSLLVLPWAGWQLLRVLGEILREGQETALVASAEAVARGLAQRPASLPMAGPGLYAHGLTRVPQLTSGVADWGTAARAHYFGEPGAGFSLLLGVANDSYYLLIDVDDDSPARGDAHWPIAARRDHVRLALHGRQGMVALRLANAQPGALKVAGIDGDSAPLRVSGQWRERDGGYVIGLVLPQGYSLRALSVTVADADDSTAVEGGAVREYGTGPASLQVRQRSAALDGSLAQLLPPATRLRVFDADGWLLAEAGQLASDSGQTSLAPWRRWLYRQLRLGRQEAAADRTADGGVRSLAGEVVTAASGASAVAWRPATAGQHLLQSAAVPLSVAGQLRGVVQLERRSDALLRLTDRAVSGLFGLTLLALLAVLVALVLFAGRLGARIRRLADAAENALDRDGRVRAFPVARARDEIGDLSRSFARLLEEVGTYTGYLRGLSGKLSHELNTPIAIVRTSLENLEAEADPARARVYLERARGGIERMAGLVRAMSEASRIEQAIEAAQAERFDLRALVAECAEAYRPLLAPRSLRLTLPAAPLPFHGAPELIVQALDKLIDNARSFCPDEGWVELRLSQDAGQAVLTVANSGPVLPEQMRGQLFDSLVSVRPHQGAGVHLGFGLHVVRLIAHWHRGQVQADNLPGGKGVAFSLILGGAAPR